jgi:hypothetical protein
MKLMLFLRHMLFNSQETTCRIKKSNDFNNDLERLSMWKNHLL